MKESIHKYFQIGMIRWMSYPRTPALEAIRKIASDDYFDASGRLPGSSSRSPILRYAMARSPVFWVPS